MDLNDIINLLYYTYERHVLLYTYPIFILFLQLQAFQPFFISLNLPYSVIRGEEFALEVIIFNYLTDATEVICSKFLTHQKIRGETGRIGN